MKILCVLLLFTLANGLNLVNLDKEWDMFKVEHNKVYKTQEEEDYRKQIWTLNTEYILAHNAAYRRGKYSYYLGQNEFGDMPNEEFTRIMNGYRAHPEVMNSIEGQGQSPDVSDLPATVDWRTKGYVTPVKNQGQCGSCWAFSSTGSLEGQTFKKRGHLTSLSEQNLVDCSTKQGNMGCNGGLMDQAFTYVKENAGLDTEPSYPYEGKDGNCRFNNKTIGATDTGFVDVKSKDENALQVAVANVGPISVAIDASHLSFQFYKGGVYHSILCSSTRLDHGVLAVGYGVYDSKDYWLVKNSWGESWGLKGYIMMSRNRNNNCGIATSASYPVV